MATRNETVASIHHHPDRSRTIVANSAINVTATNGMRMREIAAPRESTIGEVRIAPS